MKSVESISALAACFKIEMIQTFIELHFLLHSISNWCNTMVISPVNSFLYLVSFTQGSLHEQWWANWLLWHNNINSSSTYQLFSISWTCKKLINGLLGYYFGQTAIPGDKKWNFMLNFLMFDFSRVWSYPGQRQRLVQLLEVAGCGGLNGQFRTHQVMGTLGKTEHSWEDARKPWHAGWKHGMTL